MRIMTYNLANIASIPIFRLYILCIPPNFTVDRASDDLNEHGLLYFVYMPCIGHRWSMSQI